VHGVGQVSGQPGLADAGFAGQQGEPALSGGRLLPEMGQLFQLGLPADEHPAHRRQEGRQGQGRPGLGLPRHLAHRHRLGQPLQLHGSHVGETGSRPAAGHHPHQHGGQDLAGPGHQPGRLHHGGTEHVPVLEAHVAQGDPDPYRQWDAGGATLPVDCLLHGDGCCHPVGGGAEGGQHAVPQGLDLGATGLLDGAPEGGEVLAAQLIEGRFTQPGQELRRPRQVGEEDARHRPHGGQRLAVSTRAWISASWARAARSPSATKAST
jgi:hypothetical protein